tara:strand:+ start:849 stop:971 length:123 start_codon:yes stop_codon:yes gene_type:complete
VRIFKYQISMIEEFSISNFQEAPTAILMSLKIDHWHFLDH